MGLRFCPKCGNLIHPLPQENIFLCTSCGYEETFSKENQLISKENIESKELGEGIASEENKFATYEHTCPKCGHNRVQVIDVGIFYSDEDSLIILKCGKCSWSERIGDIS